jgi:hypothetical protein
MAIFENPRNRSNESKIRASRTHNPMTALCVPVTASFNTYRTVILNSTAQYIVSVKQSLIVVGASTVASSGEGSVVTG